MDKAAMTKLLAKGVVGFAFSAALGYVYKMNKKVDDKIDEYFAQEEIIVISEVTES